MPCSIGRSFPCLPFFSVLFSLFKRYDRHIRVMQVRTLQAHVHEFLTIQHSDGWLCQATALNWRLYLAAVPGIADITYLSQEVV